MAAAASEDKKGIGAAAAAAAAAALAAVADVDETGLGRVNLGPYPFYREQAPEAAMGAVFAHAEALLRQVLCSSGGCDTQVVRVQRMGSSALAGMPGTPVVDVLCEVKGEGEGGGLSDAARTKLVEEGGLDYKGLSGHCGCPWFFGGTSDSLEPGHLGRFVVHVVPAGHCFALEARDFVDYCMEHEAAFATYRDAKVAALDVGLAAEEGMKLSAYKRAKASAVHTIMAEAKAWGAARREKQQQK